MSTGRDAGIKTVHGKGVRANWPTKPSATATSRISKISLTAHFRFWRFICKSLLRAAALQILHNIRTGVCSPGTSLYTL
ncbi:MAG: hypothetical protein WAK33_21400, partial [Silvibacterium sp.]